MPSVSPGLWAGLQDLSLGQDLLWLLLNEAVAWTHTQDLTSSAQGLRTPRKTFFMDSSHLLHILQGLPIVLGIVMELFTCHSWLSEA